MASSRSSALMPLLLALSGILPLHACDKRNDPFAGLKEEWFPPSPGEVARDAFNVYDPDKRRNSVAMLSASKFGGEEPYVRTYRLLADDPDATVRAASVHALGLHGSVQDVTLLVRRLSDEASFVRWEAASALQKIHSAEEAVAPLLKALREDTDPDVRQAVCYALGQYPEIRVFTALLAALDDPQYSVAMAAGVSLSTLTGQDLGVAGPDWLAWSQQNEGKLFDQQRTYTWQPFNKPRSILDKAQFWKKHQPKPAQAPKGQDDRVSTSSS